MVGYQLLSLSPKSSQSRLKLNPLPALPDICAARSGSTQEWFLNVLAPETSILRQRTYELTKIFKILFVLLGDAQSVGIGAGCRIVRRTVSKQEEEDCHRVTPYDLHCQSRIRRSAK